MTVYIVRAIGTNMFKVGYTVGDVEKRLRELQTGCPNRLEVYHIFRGAGRGMEKEISTDLSDFTADGGSEWFSISSSVLDSRLKMFTIPSGASDEEVGEGSNDWIYRPANGRDDSIVNEIAQLQHRKKAWQNRSSNDEIRSKSYSDEEIDKMFKFLGGRGRDGLIETIQELADKNDLDFDQAVRKAACLTAFSQCRKRIDYLEEILTERVLARKKAGL